MKRKLKKLIGRLYCYLFLKKHKFPTTTYIHREKAGIVYEVELNWYDEDLEPVTLVREVKTGKSFSIRDVEMVYFIELRGNKPTDGIEI